MLPCMERYLAQGILLCGNSPGAGTGNIPLILSGIELLLITQTHLHTALISRLWNI